MLRKGTGAVSLNKAATQPVDIFSDTYWHFTKTAFISLVEIAFSAILSSLGNQSLPLHLNVQALEAAGIYLSSTPLSIPNNIINVLIVNVEAHRFAKRHYLFYFMFPKLKPHRSLFRIHNLATVFLDAGFSVLVIKSCQATSMIFKRFTML